MSRIKIETITPVHIGSGNMLKNNNDFVVENGYIHIIDPAKILQLIGEENLNSWVNNIESGGSQKEYVERKAGATPDEYSLRKIKSFCDVKEGDTLKECMHNGMGLPYIPGSSIKGAIRTAVLATLASREQGLETLVKDRKGKVNSKQIEAKFFGGSPNEDIFRFLQIGDAYFAKGSEVAIRMVMGLNITTSNELQPQKTEKPQIVEAIRGGEESELRIKITDTEGRMPNEIRTIKSLFKLINDHTRKLLQTEIEFWEKQGKNGAEEYIERIKDILAEVKYCNAEKECVLRIGHASGWRFITGAWSEKLNNFKRDIIWAARPKNKDYQDYEFPKSRRLAETFNVGEEELKSYMLGFVKLSVIE